MSMKLRVIVPPHPLIAHWLTMLRNVSTPKALYSTGLEQMGKWLTYEALREWLPHKIESVKTEEGETEGTVIQTDIQLIAIPTFPGGLELWQGARSVLPNAALSLDGVPESLTQKSGIIFYLDQITTGEILINYMHQLKEQAVESKRIRVITALASSPGLKNIGEVINDLTIYCGCIDPELNKTGSISPGIGNPSLRINTIIKPRN